ncbi:GNAT family N-acetyltransferase [Aeromicrobium sp. CTD01-1L150]|uniref:GNAT family N-acetyltransferase n=1 Tax=Aeromicrobium sp. CTD01-1L150 TaxID=3341830 RepID=UPI0035C1C35F
MPEPAPLVGPDLIGRRVTVRHQIVDDTHSSSDVVGRVLDADDTAILLERRDGSLARVRAGDVLLLRVVPDRPTRSRPAAAISEEDLTRVTSRGWPATESVPLGAWELRAAAAFTGRANSVAVHGDPGTSTTEALHAVVAFYESRGLPPLAQVVVDSDWEGRFIDAGWEPLTSYRGGAIVQVADLGAAPEPDPRVTFRANVTDSWLARYERVADAAAARAVLEGPRTVAFAELEQDGSTVAVGRIVVTGEWAGVAAVETDPAHRRRGLARAVVTSSLAWAYDRGATKAYLQTMPTNDAALALYEPFGFVTHHAYRYLRPGD